MKLDRIAYFISPHGYGHAARASAVMTALRKIDPAIDFEIFTKVPRQFFEGSLGPRFGYHTLLTDVGLAQKSSMVEDIDETIRRLDEFLPFSPAHTEQVARRLKQLGCQLVLCDISPLGLAVAQAAGLPAVLIENFTWDWIYTGYLAEDERMGRHIDYLQAIFATADYHIQTTPVCQPQPVDLTTRPVSRPSRTPRSDIRQQLGVPEAGKLVMVTMGGSGSWGTPVLESLQALENVHFIIANNSQTQERHGNVIILSRHSDLFHPDLVNAADALIGKAGYSTLAEVYYAGIPYGYILRPKFRESAILESYIETTMRGLPLTERQFENGAWLSRLPELLALPRLDRDGPNGADQIAAFIHHDI